jgi:hypothetical protein
MKKTILRAGFLSLGAWTMFGSPMAGCLPPPPPPSPDPNLVTAFMEIPSLSSCSAEGGDLKTGSEVKVSIVSYANLAANEVNRRLSYTFKKSDDQVQNAAPIRFKIEVPDNYPFKLSFTATSPKCQRCTDCSSSCSGSARIEDKGEDTFNQSVTAGDVFYVHREAFGFKCSCETTCRVQDPPADPGTGGHSGVDDDDDVGVGGGGGTGEPRDDEHEDDDDRDDEDGHDDDEPWSDADELCGAGFRAVGEYATWCGKVNVHTTPDASWRSDSDCTSGCNLNTVAYCKKLWHESSHQVNRESPTAESKTFQDAGCSSAYVHTGFNQYICCAPEH